MAKVVPVPEVYARDQMISWFRSEFAAANAIIDAFCSHLAQKDGGEEYESVFAALHCRRLNWIPVLHNQKYFPIDEISFEIRLLEANRDTARERLRLPPAQSEETINFWESDSPPAENEIPSPEEQASGEAVEGSIEVAGIGEDAAATADASSGGNSEQTSPEAEAIKVAFTEEAPAEEEPSYKAVRKTIEIAGIEKDAAATVDPSSGGNSERTPAEAEVINAAFTEEEPSDEAVGESDEVAGIEEDSPCGAKCSLQIQNAVEDGDATGGSQEPASAVDISADDGDFSARLERIKLSKGFVAKESVKGHMASSISTHFLFRDAVKDDPCFFCQVNVVKGLKMYEGIFTDSELPDLVQFINGLRHAGRRGELSGETFIFFNKQMKGNKREIIQFGVPLFQPTTEGESTTEPIPPELQNVIDHLVLWHIIPDNKKPNSCIINFFDEDDYSQPYFKPPHLENPILTLVLSETTMAFGRSLISDPEGNYKGSLILTLNEGALIAMRGNSADMARHAVCASPNKRMTVTFVKVKTAAHSLYSPTASRANQAMIWWRPECSLPQPTMPMPGVIAYGPQAMIPLQAPAAVMVAQPGEVVLTTSRRNSPPHNGTGVFLPWATVAPKKYTKHLPPRIQKRRQSFFPSSLEAQA
ncbi:hypothetical protein ZIOFF_031135 [Zingiber officinale]|uniref:Fe2OG dioxygenase domain-containing protein n=1 Tax=Zingiber officinale TaxID=94328 RepID=A0A8J5H606_ZINOF|nr:hypothetical protein ZIOFF_031135 [Zingiber officinale]